VYVGNEPSRPAQGFCRRLSSHLERMDEKTHISSATCGRSSGAVLQEAVPSVVREETQ